MGISFYLHLFIYVHFLRNTNRGNTRATCIFSKNYTYLYSLITVIFIFTSLSQALNLTSTGRLLPLKCNAIWFGTDLKNFRTIFYYRLQTTAVRHIVEESNLHIHREDNLKSHFLYGSLRQLGEHMDTQRGRQRDKQTDRHGLQMGVNGTSQ
jgi:hypothetical protein